MEVPFKGKKTNLANKVTACFLNIDFSILCLYVRIHDNGREISVGKNNLLLRGCVIRNTDWVEGMVVYAGQFPN